jgi:hypothetical protein
VWLQFIDGTQGGSKNGSKNGKDKDKDLPGARGVLQRLCVVLCCAALRCVDVMGGVDACRW